jgi:mono/diheme cytochrome c family protein
MNVRRGAKGQGVTAQKCSTCHQENNLPSPNMPPGTHDWQMPPAKMPMVWEGLTDRELCELFKDPNRNGNRRALTQIVQHTQTALVAWGWHPGEGRTPIPGTHAEFVTKIKQWADAGGACPVAG